MKLHEAAKRLRELAGMSVDELAWDMYVEPWLLERLEAGRMTFNDEIHARYRTAIGVDPIMYLATYFFNEDALPCQLRESSRMINERNRERILSRFPTAFDDQKKTE